MNDNNPQPRDFEPSLPPVNVDRDDATTTIDHDDHGEDPFSGIDPPSFLDDASSAQRLSGPQPEYHEDTTYTVDHDDPGIDGPSVIRPL